jgi:endonuclease-3 related protein
MPGRPLHPSPAGLYRRLFRHFGPQKWWPAQSAWEMMVGAILTQNTAWTNVDKALANLKQARALSVRAVARMPRRRLERLIRPSGYFRQKAGRLQSFAREMERDPRFFKALSGAIPGPRQRARTRGDRRKQESSKVQRPAPADPTGLRHRLLSLHGIGPETADSILLYAGGYPCFVVDAYTRRIGQRIGLFRTNDYHEVQRYFEQALPRESALYNEYHALLVALAKQYCSSCHPDCGRCPASRQCRHAQREK